MFRHRGQRTLRGMEYFNDPPILQQANEMIASGNYAGAADTYYRLAQGAETRFLQRAPFLYMEAGRAAILSGEAKVGVAHIRRALTILASQGRIQRMQMFGQRAVDELQARKLNAEADEITALINVNMPQGNPPTPTPTKKPILPTHCPSCGGAVRPDEIEWLDEVTAECAYCGSPVREN